jgi:hypothetical protein
MSRLSFWIIRFFFWKKIIFYILFSADENLVFPIREMTMTEGVWEQAAAENIWMHVGGSNTKMEKIT